eukprot:TRINITY_DN11708_c0_g1_i2.p1 TRINITY_DN11708_c0_g1~~TRINITY_DN11708_c0_g1_i2.p1  ORF type:complete len:293 (-),score=25.67 TRINITY_DN11708_c0_g1_i2:250-1128(-)
MATMLQQTISKPSSSFPRFSTVKMLPVSQVVRSRVLSARRCQEGQVQQLPVFPLGLVAFPGADVPLQIFEARYRVLFNTLLAGQKDIDELLVQEESPFKGSQKFGLNFMSERGLVEVGTTLQIQEHTTLDDGRLLVVNKGVERYRIRNVVQEKPVLICEVEILPEDDDQSAVATELQNEVVDLFVNIQKLNLKMKSLGDDTKLVDPNSLKKMSPRMASYWITSLFHNSQMHQQALLEMHSSRERLAKLKDILEQTQKYLTAASALKSAFSTDLGSTSSEQTSSQKEGEADNV